MSRLICLNQSFLRVTYHARNLRARRAARDGQAVLPVFPAAFAEEIVHHGSDVLDRRQAARRANAGDARVAVAVRDDEAGLLMRSGSLSTP